MKTTIRHARIIALLLLVVAGFASCKKTDDASQWKIVYGFTAEELAGSYMPNPADWDAVFVDGVENAKAVRNAQASITKTSENTVIVQLLGMPGKLENTFSCTIHENDFMFNSGDLSVKVYKNNDNVIRLNGCVRFFIGQHYEPSLGNSANGYMVNMYEYYYFDVIKQ